MSKRVLFVHSTGNWWDHRYYFKQMPALKMGGYDVTYMIKEEEDLSEANCELVTIPKSKYKNVRKSGGLSLLSTILKLKYKNIQICNIELLPLGIILSVLFGKKVFYDCREDHYHAMLHSKTWFPFWVRYLLGRGVKVIEFLAAKSFTGFIVSDPALFKYHKAINDGKKILFYNMALKEQFGKVNKENKVYDVVVLGSMSVRTGVLDVVKAIAELKKQNIKLKLKLIGNPAIDKALFKQINEIIEQNDLNNDVKITGKVPYSQVPVELSDCRISVIPLLDLPKFRNNMATKQFEYMASALPVITTDLPPQQYFIKEGFNGTFYEPGNVEQLAEKIKYFVNNPDKLSEMGNNGLTKINESWNSETQQKKFLEFYDKRIAGKMYNETQLPPIEF